MRVHSTTAPFEGLPKLPMRKFVFLLLIGLFAGGAFVAYPFVTAWSVREAVKSGDSAYLERKLEWDSVRESLRSSMARVAFNLPEVSPSQEGEADASVAAPARSPGLWARVKGYVGRGAVNKLVDTYATPEGLPQLFQYGKMYRETVKGQTEPAVKPPWYERAKRFWARVKRAEFLTPTRFEIVMADRFTPDRHYRALLNLRGLEWKVSEIHVIAPTAAVTPVAANDPAVE